MATPGLLKIKVLLNKDDNVIISVHDVTNKILSCDSNYIVDMAMWPKFGNSRIFRRKVIIISVLKLSRFWGLNPKFVEVTEEKLVVGAFQNLK